MTRKTFVYVGTYTEEMSHVPESKGEGIHVFEFDRSTGQLTDKDIVQSASNPSYLAIANTRQYLYAVSEVGDGSVSSFAIDHETGALTYLNQQSTHGSATAYVAVDKQDTCVLAANYWDGQSVTLMPINPDGSLEPATSTHEHTMPAAGTVPSRQDKSHAHCIVPSPDNRFALVCDLGLDKVMIYRLDTKSHQLIEHDIPFLDMHAGSGSRHLVFHPSQNMVYVINELNSTIAVLSYDVDTAQLAYEQVVSTKPDSFTANSTSDIHISPDGKHLYGANRGHNSLAIYEINPDNGHLTSLGYQSTEGKIPRNFVIDPSGEFVLVANQDSHNIVIFRRDANTGLLTKVSKTECPTPVCLKILDLDT